ncbi:serine carboxypeptidase-like [Hordeum vulgare]|nr:serine carboxypeptidase-like [Hordeum vulgare]
MGGAGEAAHLRPRTDGGAGHAGGGAQGGERGQAGCAAAHCLGQSVGDDHECFLSKFKDRIDRYASVGRGDALPAETIVERPIRLASLVVGDDGGGNTSVSNLGNHARYYRLPTTHDAKLFYFFFESRRHKKEEPVVIWLTGGPGCSSELALFYDNGPFHITDNMSLLWNEFGWDQESNLIYIDRPTGTGFSYSSNSHDTRHNEAGVSNDLYDFLQSEFNKVNKVVPACEFVVKLCGTSVTVSYLAAYFVCNTIFSSIRLIIGNKNVGCNDQLYCNPGMQQDRTMDDDGVMSAVVFNFGGGNNSSINWRNVTELFRILKGSRVDGRRLVMSLQSSPLNSVETEVA